MEQHYRPLAFINLLPIINKVAKEHGYAITIHGSLQRDYDLVAIPWTDKVSTCNNLIAAIEKACGGFQLERVSKKRPYYTRKPHGRKAYIIHLGAGVYMDISVMPKKS